MRIVAARLTAEVDPGRGAKITSLREPDGTEWLAQSAARGTPRGLAFLDAEMAGWDECAPTIVACRVLDREVPDHGDLWDTPFEEVDGALHAVGTSLEYCFARRISPTRDGLRIDYRAEALDRPVPFLWAAHPQFAAPPGTRVELNESVTSVVDVLDPGSAVQPWSTELATIDTLADGTCRKVYVDPAKPVDSARLVRADGRGLTLRWSAAAPYLGLWFDNREYARQPVIALEPATAFYDSLATAIGLGRAPMLEPGHPLHWWVEVVPFSRPPTGII